jgi:2-keto-3-deoxy-6-phosphogluconate aldolase
MKKAEVCALIKEIGIVPAIRMSSAEDAHFAAESITQGGVPIVEITMTVADAIGLISHLVRYHPNMLVGAGTIMDTEMARQCVDAGASFLTSPGLDTYRGDHRVAGRIRLRQSVSLRTSWWRQLYQSSEGTSAADSIDRRGGA